MRPQLGCDVSTPRGGVRVHQSQNDSFRFTRFAQPLMRPISDLPPPQGAISAWKESIIELHNSKGTRKRSRSSRGSLKRKRAAGDEEQLVWNLQEILQRQLRGETGGSSMVLGEDSALAMEYLHCQHHGNVTAAKLDLIVGLSAGRATRVRKAAKRKAADRSKSMTCSFSDCWRTTYASMALPSLALQVGQRGGPVYGLSWSKLSSGRLDARNQLPMSQDDDLKCVWRSLLASGKLIEQQLNRDGVEPKKLLLSTIVTFVGNAYQLPTPESCFGTHHVIVEEVSTCITVILKHAQAALDVQAKLRDLLCDESAEGIETDRLRKFLETEGTSLPLSMDEVVECLSFTEVVSEWEQRVSRLLESTSDFCDCPDTLGQAEDLAVEAGAHGYRSRALVDLQARVRKACDLRCRISKWQECCQSVGTKTTTRTVSTLVRDANKIRFSFREVTELLSFNRDMEDWIERATVAIRSRISLEEIKGLLERGEGMPVDLSEFLDKLRVRVRTAENWLEAVDEVIPGSLGMQGKTDMLRWMRTVRTSLADGKYTVIHDLASEGSRIPVEVDTVKLLQVELDAKNWTNKARKWMPSGGDSKKGKLEDIREHCEKAIALRERLPLCDSEKESWPLEFEDELVAIVNSADTWLYENQRFLEGDNRRNRVRNCVSIKELRRIVEQGNAISANVGNASAKVSRILSQAEAWYTQYQPLLVRCGLEDCVDPPSSSCVDLSEMLEAVESAASVATVDLDEAVNLKDLAQKAQTWLEQAALLAPRRSKRSARQKSTLEDLTRLIEQAPLLPINTEDEVVGLEELLHDIEIWRAEACKEMQQIAIGFKELRETINATYGAPAEFSLDQRVQPNVELDEESSSCGMVEDGHATDTAAPMKDHPPEEPSGKATGFDVGLPSASAVGNLQPGVHRIIKELNNRAKVTSVGTTEADLADSLESVSRWCIRSLRYMAAPREVFDKRYFGAFDRFIQEGRDLLGCSESNSSAGEKSITEQVGESFGSLVSDQLDRLAVLRRERELFSEWCELANHSLKDDKRLTADRLSDLAEKSRRFPSDNEMVQRIRGLSVKVKSWVDEFCDQTDAGKKLSMQDAKALLDSGERLKVNTQELRALKSSIRAARGWANKVKRCNLEQGATQVSAVEHLIAEHENLMVALPEELSSLKQATQSYCVCRRPYDGFMIGCDECEEWYHGPCIGISESRADRVDKYVCIRCSIKNVFNNCAGSAAAIIRKWTSSSELKKARQVDNQRHQRKVRKEQKDLEKFQKMLREHMQTLDELNSKSTGSSQPSDPCRKTSEDADVKANEPSESSGLVVSKSEGDLSRDDNVGTQLTQTAHSTQVEKLQSNVRLAEERLKLLSGLSAKRKRTEQVENDNCMLLRRWCVRVRSSVLVPSCSERAEAARPCKNGVPSPPMNTLLGDATALGIGELPDVEAMMNSLKCMCWSLHTLSELRSKPYLVALSDIVSQARYLKLPDEKPVRTMKTMIQRATQLQARVARALSPKPNPNKPIGQDLLKELLATVDRFTVRLPETSRRLKLVVDDNGTRHCICGGPTDGRFMLSCDKCEKWFHGKCVRMEKEECEGLGSWICGCCAGGEPLCPSVAEGAPAIDWQETREGIADGAEASPHAPDPDSLWPPFSLLGSSSATEVLSAECIAIPDDVVSIDNNVTPMQIASREDLLSKKEPSSDRTIPLAQLQELVGARQTKEPLRDTATMSAATSAVHQGLDAGAKLDDAGGKTVDNETKPPLPKSSSVQGDAVLPVPSTSYGSEASRPSHWNEVEYSKEERNHSHHETNGQLPEAAPESGLANIRPSFDSAFPSAKQCQDNADDKVSSMVDDLSRSISDLKALPIVLDSSKTAIVGEANVAPNEKSERQQATLVSSTVLSEGAAEEENITVTPTPSDLKLNDNDTDMDLPL